MGTVVVTLVAVAVVTVVRVAPKNTILLAAVVLKPLPVSVTTSPGLADVGLKDVMTGGMSGFRNTIMEFVFQLGNTRSGLPSPSKSPMTT